MPAIKNSKHEAFAQAFIEHDGSPKKVMKTSGFKWNPSYFSQLKNKPTISARITELRKKVVSTKILLLQDRLEILSDFARNPELPASHRIKALAEIHRQSGDDVQRVDMDLTAETQSVITFVEIHLPKVTNKGSKGSKELVTGKELDSLDEFLK